MNHPDIPVPDYEKLPLYFAHAGGGGAEDEEYVLYAGTEQKLTLKRNDGEKTLEINGKKYYDKDYIDEKINDLTSKYTDLQGRVTTLEG